MILHHLSANLRLVSVLEKSSRLPHLPPLRDTPCKFERSLIPEAPRPDVLRVVRADDPAALTRLLHAANPSRFDVEVCDVELNVVDRSHAQIYERTVGLAS